ncbi:MAG TPA: methylglyoxal synthase [Ruminiclostridium sp.]|nr:methylglyoxal synthase [Ruminiclostridium sp.]
MIMDDYINIPIPKQKHIALIAHDHKKQELVEWVKDNIQVLRKHFLCGTGTTARIIAEEVELPVRAYNSGPLGGDLQIGSRIVEGGIDVVIFFWDPLEAQPHDPDVKALLRIAAVYDIPIANNRATADFILSSQLMDTEYNRKIINYNKKMQNRVNEFKEK